MIQVDVFWSFAMGAQFASLAAQGLKKSDSMFVNKYFVYTVCYLSLCFAPSGVYLLWQYTGWETMFFLDRSLRGIWPLLFAHTNVSLGIIGFVLAYLLIKSGREMQANYLWTASYTAMFAILTFGYDRFLYAGTQDEWRRAVPYKLQDFFQCEVFYALLGLATFVVPPLFYAMIFWPAEHGITRRQKASLLRHSYGSYMVMSGLVAAVFVGLQTVNHLPDGWGYDRLTAFLIGESVLGCAFFGPLLFIPTTRKGEAKSKLT